MRPVGNTDFRVTQQFDDINPAFPQYGQHRATDLGNFRCGDPVVAMEAGNARAIGPDQYGALGVIVRHEGDVESVYWHLNAFSIPQGSTVPVTKGQQLGIVGSTGLGAVCHLHIEIKVGGVKIDPEPHIFGAPLEVGDVLAEKTTFLDEPFKAKLANDVAIRSDTRVAADTLLFRVSGFVATVIGVAQGDEFNGSTDWWVYGIHNRSLACFHSKTATKLPSDAFTADDLAAAKAEGNKAGQVDMKTRATVVVQGLAIK